MKILIIEGKMPKTEPRISAVGSDTPLTIVPHHYP